MDISGVEQESICIRHVDENLNIFETYIGLFKVTHTTGKSLALMIVETLKTFNLDVKSSDL